MQERIIVCSVILIVVFGIALFAVLMNEIISLKDFINVQNRKHQKWLFDQLYAIAPGKVLLPDEKEAEAENKPATVYIPENDPYAEFKGIKDDWHS